MDRLLEALPPRLLRELRFAAPQDRLREIHLRAGRKTEIVADRGSILLEYRALREDLELMLETAMDRSYYAAREFLRDGFCTAPGGCRIGITGTVVTEETGVLSIRELSGMNIRIARAVPGFADAALEVIRKEPASMLILGRPGSGKTTLLRDLIRQISDRLEQRVSVADTRFELGGVYGGVPTMDLGQRTDLLCGGSKETGILMLLRCMNPRWIAVDEITAEADVRAMERCVGCGVELLATAHAWDRSDLLRRPVYRAMVRAGIFRHLVELDRAGNYTVGKLEEADG